MFQEVAAHELFWKWGAQALLEIRHLRQTERLDEDDSWIFPILNNSADTATILPITTPEAFTLQQQQHEPERIPWFRSGARRRTTSSLGWHPGKRFSFREMSQKACKPEHYRWYRESVELRLIKDASCKDQTATRSWPRLASLFWTDGSAAHPHGQR